MKKILYYTCRDMTAPGAGINKKISEQIECFQEAGFSVDAFYRIHDSELALRNDRETVIKGGMKRPYKIAASKYVRKYIKNKKYDGAYIRYVYGDKEFFRLLKCLKRKGTTTVIEIPTYPYDKELKDSLENRIVLFLDKCYRNRMVRYVDRIVTFSRDKRIFKIPTIRTMNGLNFKKVMPVSNRVPYDGTIQIIAVADLARWHGYDRILEGIGDYYQNGGKRKILFHLVGEGPELESYKSIIEKRKIQEHVVLHGRKYGKDLDEIYETCNVAAECFGIHRRGGGLSSSLKSREYVAKGLPVIASADIDMFLKKKSPYYLKFPEDESAIDMEQVIAFCDGIYEGKTRGEVVNAIRSRGELLCDFKVVMKPIFETYR